MSGNTSPVETYLRILLIEFYSHIIEEARRSSFQLAPNLYKEIREHETYKPLLVSIANDRGLAKFFPALRESQNRRGDSGFIHSLQSIIVWSDASSEGMTPLMLCSSIIGEVFRHLWSWTDEPTLDAVLARLPHSIDLARNLAERHTVQIPGVVSIHNIDLLENDRIPIGSALLRKPIRYDRSRLHPAVSGQDLNAVLRLEADFSAIHIRSTGQAADQDEENRKTSQITETLGYPSMESRAWNFQGAVDRARLAIVLASDPERLFAPVPGWDSVVNPLSDLYHSQITSARSFNAPYPSQGIDEPAIQRIAFWAPRLEKYPDVLRMGIRRLLLAITERMYPEDGFVDAIICWENLFSGTPETTLRVCGAMAKLLYPEDAGDRRHVYSELAELYKKRNAVVHGSAKKFPVVTAQDRNLAISYTLKAFDATYRREDLLSIKSSPERGLSVLLEL